MDIQIVTCFIYSNGKAFFTDCSVMYILNEFMIPDRIFLPIDGFLC